MYLHDYRWSVGFTSQELNVTRRALLFCADENAEGLTQQEAEVAGNMSRVMRAIFEENKDQRKTRETMYLHDYRWSAGFTSQELDVVCKALLFAADENAPELTEQEADLAADMARIIGGVYAAKRAERNQRQGQRQPRHPRQQSQPQHVGS